MDTPLDSLALIIPVLIAIGLFVAIPKLCDNFIQNRKQKCLDEDAEYDKLFDGYIPLIIRIIWFIFLAYVIILFLS